MTVNMPFNQTSSSSSPISSFSLNMGPNTATKQIAFQQCVEIVNRLAIQQLKNLLKRTGTPVNETILRDYASRLSTISEEDHATSAMYHEQAHEKEKAHLSRLFLILSQLQKGEMQRAIGTLESCNPNLINIQPLVEKLKLLSGPITENVITQKE